MPLVLLWPVTGIVCAQYPRTCRKRSSAKPPKSPSKFCLPGCAEFLWADAVTEMSPPFFLINVLNARVQGSPYLASMSVNPRRVAVAAWRQPRASLGDARGCTPPGDGGSACFTSLSNGNGRHHSDTQQLDASPTECEKHDEPQSTGSSWNIISPETDNM